MEFQCRLIVQRRCTSCCSSVENIPLQAERHSVRGQKLFAFPPESAFTFRLECCSGSQRNRVRLHSGIAFTFRPDSPSSKKTSGQPLLSVSYGSRLVTQKSETRQLDIPKAAKGWSTPQTSTSAFMAGYSGGAVGDLGPYAHGAGTLSSPLRPGTIQIKYAQDFLARFAEKYWLSPAATSFSPRSRLRSSAVTTAEISLPCTGSDWE